MILNAFHRRLSSQQTLESALNVLSKPLSQLPTEMCLSRLFAPAHYVGPVVRAMIGATIGGRPQGCLLVT